MTDSPELYECIHCGQEDTAFDHWETCPNHPARARVAELEARLEAVRAASVEECSEVLDADYGWIHVWYECRVCRDAAKFPDQITHGVNCWLATALGWERGKNDA